MPYICVYVMVLLIWTAIFVIYFGHSEELEQMRSPPGQHSQLNLLVNLLSPVAKRTDAPTTRSSEATNSRKAAPQEIMQTFCTMHTEWQPQAARHMLIVPKIYQQIY